MPLRQPPRHIKAMLDRHYPGMKLEWNPRIGYWALTDDLYANGQKTYRPAYKPSGGMVGIEKYPLSRRALLWVLGDTRTGERWEPSRDRILNAINRAYNGGKSWLKERFIDRFEEEEDERERVQKLAGNSEKKDRMGEWFDREVRGKSSFSRLCATTAKGVSRELSKRAAAANAENEESDAIADSMIRSGRFASAGSHKVG